MNDKLKIGITCYPTLGGSGVVATELGKLLAVRGPGLFVLVPFLDAAAASLWLDAGAASPAAMLERGFARVFGRTTARRAAHDVARWEQQGCYSPHVVYVETGGGLMPEPFAAQLAGELARLEQETPRGPVPTEVAAAIAAVCDGLPPVFLFTVTVVGATILRTSGIAAIVLPV